MSHNHLTGLFDRLVSSAFFSPPFNGYDVAESFHALVFLTGSFAYKMRKPSIVPGIVDYSTPALRGTLLKREIELNSVFGHSLYEEVIPVYHDGHTGYNRTGNGTIVDHVLKMKQMPAECLMSSQLENDYPFSENDMLKLAQTVARFHENAPPVIRPYTARMQAGAERAIQFFAQRMTSERSRTAVSRTRAAFADLGPIMENRAQQGFVKDIHGDLRFCNIFFVAGRYYIFDRIEYDDDLRIQDITMDVAATITDLLAYGKTLLAKTYLDEYCRLTGDDKIRVLLPLYLSIKAMVSSSIAFELRSQTQDQEKREFYSTQVDRFLDVVCRI